MNKQDLLIEELHRENICTYYVLPLIKLSKYEFVTEQNFVDSFLERDLSSIYVQVTDIRFFAHRVASHPQYMATRYGKRGGTYIQYAIPMEWREDVVRVTRGMYSTMSDAAKERIRTYSKLQYRVRGKNGKPVTDVRLLVLHKSRSVREMWENSFGLLIDDGDELFSMPTERIFIDQDILRLA